MKQHFSKAAALIMSAAIMLASCQKPEKTEPVNPGTTEPGTETQQLATPVITLTASGDNTLTAEWEEVINAESYVVVLDDGEEQPTSQLSAVFSGLTDGTHTVKVKARTSLEGFTESEWGEASHTFEAWISFEWFLQETVMDGTQYYKYNSIFIKLKGTGVADVRMGMFYDTQGYSDDQMIEIIRKANDSDVKLGADALAAVNGEGYEKGYLGVSPSTQYDMVIVAVNENGEEQLIRENVATEAASEGYMPPEYEPWLGSWTLETTQTMSWGNNPETGLMGVYFEDIPMAMNVNIEFDQVSGELVMTGLSVSGESNLSQKIRTLCDVDEDGNLCLLAGAAVGTYQQYDLLWLGIGVLEDGTASPLSGGEYTAYTMIPDSDGVTAVSEASVIDLTNGLTAVINGYDVFAVDGSGGTAIVSDKAPAGKFTMTRISSERSSVSQDIITSAKSEGPLGYCSTIKLRMR